MKKRKTLHGESFAAAVGKALRRAGLAARKATDRSRSSESKHRVRDAIAFVPDFVVIDKCYLQW